MLHLRKDRWIGNAWASIDISPNDETYFLRILAYLAHRYGFPFPHVSDLIDGYVADFQILTTDTRTPASTLTPIHAPSPLRTTSPVIGCWRISRPCRAIISRRRHSATVVAFEAFQGIRNASNGGVCATHGPLCYAY
jgi:hypothetical protein